MRVRTLYVKALKHDIFKAQSFKSLEAQKDKGCVILSHVFIGPPCLLRSQFFAAAGLDSRALKVSLISIHEFAEIQGYQLKQVVALGGTEVRPVSKKLLRPNNR